MSATHYLPSTEESEGRGAKIARIERIRNARAIGYVTRYLTKSVAVGERGIKEVQRERLVIVEDEQGQTHTHSSRRLPKRLPVRRIVSAIRAIFFPEKVSELRAQLFAGLENETMEQAASEDCGQA
jgi:hypothetical protein